MAAGPPPVIHQGRYSLTQQLGSGSFGEVWLATDNLQGDQVAVKLLAPHVELDAALLEAQILTRLRQHERVVTIRNVELAPPVPFIVMDYEPGGSVGQLLDVGEVRLADALRYTRESLDGLAHAHDEGVLHRDIKPDNLLLDAENRVVLSDFGIAEDTMRALLAVAHVYVPHAAPELLAGGSSSQATDIFAIGCTLHRLLSGELPFASRAKTEAGSFIAAHRLNPQVPLAVSRIVAKALAADPADRFSDAREMLGALTACRVARSWVRADQEGEIETWELEGADGDYVLHLSKRRNGKFRVRVTRDKGAGARKVLEEDFARESDALRVRRNRLLLGVES
jgi:serine/threonine protein kinase